MEHTSVKKNFVLPETGPLLDCILHYHTRRVHCILPMKHSKQNQKREENMNPEVTCTQGLPLQNIYGNLTLGRSNYIRTGVLR